MDFLHIFVLAMVQGITEFLPISSSAHLILVPVLLGWQDQGLMFDVAVHVGTLAAVIMYFRHEVVALARDWSVSIVQRKPVGESRLAWAVIVGTIPAGLAGLMLKDHIETLARAPLVIAGATLCFGLLLWLSDVHGKHKRNEHELSWRDIVMIGLAQALALIPGTSRSGITMTAGLFLGLTRTAAARFSFLLSIPLIASAGSLHVLNLVEQGSPDSWTPILIGAPLAGICGYLGIHFLLSLVSRVGMLPFVIYRLLLGAWLLVLFY